MLKPATLFSLLLSPTMLKSACRIRECSLCSIREAALFNLLHSLLFLRSATCPDSLFVGTCWTCGKYCCNQCYRCVKNDGGGVFRCGECRARLRGQRRPQLGVFTTPVRLAYDGDTYTYAEYVEFYGEQGAARMWRAPEWITSDDEKCTICSRTTAPVDPRRPAGGKCWICKRKCCEDCFTTADVDVLPPDIWPGDAVECATCHAKPSYWWWS